MNILPKKSWHVRNKDNIERVRRDEEKAANEEKERLRRVALAESEARTDLLRLKASKRKYDTEEADVESPAVVASTARHINFFEELEEGKKIGGKNVEHEEEKRKEKEDKEKAIGLLTYLGQGSVELQETKPWYFKVPERSQNATKSSASSSSKEITEKDEVDTKRKRGIDPIHSMEKYISVSNKVHAARTNTSSQVAKPDKKKSSSVTSHGPTAAKTIEQLRAERLKREQQERQREQQLVAKLRGGPDVIKAPEPITDERQMRYNSQFNPDFVRRPIRPSDNLY